MTKDKALKLALEALLINCGGNTEGIGKEAITAIREALSEQPAQQEPDLSMREPSAIRDRLIQAGWTPPAQQEPVDWEAVAADQAMTIAMMKAERKRQWTGLTDEEKITMSGYDLHYAALIGQIERKLKEKNSD